MPGSNPSVPPAGPRLVARLMLFLLIGGGLLGAVGGVAGLLQARDPDRDSRRRLLWDHGEHREPIVLLGDSAFCSYYVEREEDTLWARLSTLTGKAVFPGALDGARGPDILMAAEVVAGSWPPGTAVVIELAPTKLLPLAESPAERLAEREGNYKRWLDRRIARRAGEAPLQSVERWLRFHAASPFLAVRHPELLESLARRALGALRPTRRVPSRHAVWTDKREAVGGKLDQLLAKVRWGGKRPDAAWLIAAVQVLRAAKLRPLVFVGPFNHDLVGQVAGGETAEQLRVLLAAGRADLADRLAAAGAPLVQMPADPPTECFSDFVHPNTCGEEAVARYLADRLRDPIEDAR